MQLKESSKHALVLGFFLEWSLIKTDTPAFFNIKNNQGCTPSLRNFALHNFLLLIYCLMFAKTDNSGSEYRHKNSGAESILFSKFIKKLKCKKGSFLTQLMF